MNNCSVWKTVFALEAIAYARNAGVVKDNFLPAEGGGGCLCSGAANKLNADQALAGLFGRV